MLRTKQRLRRHDAVRKEKRFSLKTKWRKNTGSFLYQIFHNVLQHDHFQQNIVLQGTF
ncbi:hypothetical protein YC2023_040338 [Brassica napus]